MIYDALSIESDVNLPLFALLDVKSNTLPNFEKYS